ncbi:hypothetical protein C2869_04080 [Saccharobesus litoralis]|uniref:Malectin domain-containing protein n=2 Tax=Saccharobesus litoralis TaxID=2172099 RepID=A0A2S0VN68_9ALTE|nr:hypothetical protein C2869_04080 [Saccharobesus litoralis]
MENTDYPTGWELVTGNGATGDSYIQWTPWQAFQTPEAGLISIHVEIHNPGVYRMQWRNSIRHGTSPSDHNDTWIKILAQNFYGKKPDGHTVCPRQQEHSNTCEGEAPEGSSAKGAFKVYRFGTPADAWVWHAYTSDNNAHPIYADFAEAGVYEIQVSARSTYHALDRMVLYKTNQVSEISATTITNAESTIMSTTTAKWNPPAPEPEPDTGDNGGPKPSAFDVAVTPIDDSLVEPADLIVTAQAVDATATMVKATLYINGLAVNSIEGAGPYQWTANEVGAFAKLTGGRPNIKVALENDSGEIGYQKTNVRINGLMVGTYVHAYNLGGSDYTAKDGQLFTGIGWAGLTTSEDIIGTEDDELYQKQQTSAGWMALHGASLIGDIALNPGSTYQIDYYFAEIEHTKSGQRAVDIHNQHAKIANALDIFAAAGANTAYKHAIVFTAVEDVYKTGMQTNAVASFDTHAAIAAFSVRYLDRQAWDDDDSDGVFNFDDKCASTAVDANVDDKGCELP